MLRNISSLTPKEKFKSIGQHEAKEIIKGIRDLNIRGKLNPVAASLGTGRASLIKLVKGVKTSQGAAMADKLIRAAQKHLNKGVDPNIQKRFMKMNMQRDESGLKRNEHEIAYAGGNITTRSIGANETRTKGSMGDIGVKRGTVGFAKNFNGGKSPDKPAPSVSGGTRPIGL